MKTKTLKLTPIYMLLLPLCVVILCGCEKDENGLWEIYPDSEATIIQNEVDGIEFKFYLLNEAGEAATVFNEGENFTIYFSVTNHQHKKIYFDPGFAHSKDISFCQINNSDGNIIGKPYEVLTVLDIGAAAYPFDRGQIYSFKVPWADVRENVWYWENGTYISLHQKLLEKGSYYTEFEYRFQFSGEEPILTDALHFKINFKIQ